MDQQLTLGLEPGFAPVLQCPYCREDITVKDVESGKVTKEPGRAPMHSECALDERMDAHEI